MAIKFKRPQPPCSTSHTPTNLQQEFNYYNQVLLSWDAIPGVSSYAVWEDYTKNVYTVHTNHISLTDIDVPGTTDAWAVRVACGGSLGNWAFSDYTTPVCTETITNLQATNITSTSVLLTWDAVPGVYAYQVWHSDGAIFQTIIGANNNSLQLTNLTPGKQNIDVGARVYCYSYAGMYGDYTWMEFDLL
jgi:hypothetical protein